MQTKSFKILLPVVVSYVAFLLAWGFSQALELWLNENGTFFQVTFFMVVYTALTGIAIPLALARRFGFELHEQTSGWRSVIGYLALGIVLAMSVFFSDALPLLRENPPTLAGVFKYVLLFVPMALGICLQCFFLIPRSLEAALPGRWWTPVLAVAASALSVGLGFWVDKLFQTTEYAVIQTLLGIFLGLGIVLTRSFYWTYACYLVAILVNTLSEGKYFQFSWGALVIGFLAACLGLSVNFLVRGDRANRQDAH